MFVFGASKMKTKISCIIILGLSLLILSCNTGREESPEVMSGGYWKTQALEHIMPYWTGNAIDKKYGAFHTNLDSVWDLYGSRNKFPSMISRHLFSYSSAYLLSGDDEDIRIADSTFSWLIEKAWDKEYGGWYDALDEKGDPVQDSKTTFVQVYAVTGLTMYYLVTRDKKALEYIEKSNNLLERHVWDSVSKGYFNSMNRDWSILDSNKSFSSMITPVSGYLIYLYQATNEQKYLDQISRILDVTIEHMIDPESGWVLEDFDRDWNYLSRKNDASEVNIGHNIEASWMLLRNYLLTDNKDHLKSAQLLAEKIRSSGVFRDNGIWLTSAGRPDPSLHSPDTYWWIQAYGNMFSLYLYKISGNEKYLDDFRKGAVLWENSFMDYRNGDTFFSVDSSGNVTDARKANQFKASYHNIEHCLLNFLALNLWVNNDPVELHFRIRSSVEGDLLYTNILEDKYVKIKKAVIDSGEGGISVKDEGVIILPEIKDNKVTVVQCKGD